MFTFKLIYSVISAVLTSIILSFVFNLYNFKVNYVRTITKTMLVAVFVVPLYVFFFFQNRVEIALFIDSVYFISTDWMAFFIFKFCLEFTGRDTKVKKFYGVYIVLALIDSAQLLINNFTYHSFWLERAETLSGFVYWSLSLTPIHYIHLAFCYIMVLQSFGVLLYETIVAPFYYKAKYFVILFTYFLIILTNMICYSADLPVDISILLYGIFAAYISWCSAYKVPSRMILLSLERVNSVITDGILYFNVNDECIYVNSYVVKTFSGDERFSKKYATEKIRQHMEQGGNTEHLFWQEKEVINGEPRTFVFEYEKLYHSKVPIGSFLKVIETTEREKMVDKQRYISTHDSLTGIYNRNKFFEICNQMIKDSPEEERYMLASNIQNFKIVNEVFGRKVGDTILKMEAEEIKKACLGRNDCVYGRISEDKFAMFVPKSFFNPIFFEHSVISLKKLVKTSNFSLRIILGISEQHGFFENAQILYDEALLAIKTLSNDFSKNYAYYSSELMEKMLVEKNIVSDFPDAIRNEQFKIQLQPIFDNKDLCVGAEALVYWNHPEYGEELPKDFLSVLENYSLIHVLDTYVLERVIQILKVWKENGQDDKVISVNISTKDIYHMSIYEVVTGLVNKYEINPNNLYLEFKETLLTADAQGAKTLLSDLQKFGIKVGIDNFGRGYSSLNLLKDVKANFLKIDMLFLSESENEERSYKILKFIVALAKTLNMTVISQGVEQKNQYEILQQLKCNFMQGYYYSKPMGITEFEKKYLS